MKTLIQRQKKTGVEAGASNYVVANTLEKSFQNKAEKTGNKKQLSIINLVDSNNEVEIMKVVPENIVTNIEISNENNSCI